MKQRIRSLIFLLVTSGILWLGLYTSLLVYRTWGIIDTGFWWFALQGIGIFFPLVITFSLFWGGKKWNKINAFVFRTTSAWIVFIAGLFMSTYLAATVNVLWLPLPPEGLAISALTIAVLFVIYGVLNARRARTRHISIPATPLLRAFRGKKIVLVSDIHIGLVWRKRFLSRVIERVMREQGDMVIIAGDLIDGPVFPYLDFLESLKKLAAPLGVYYTPGNHEQYNPDNKNFYKNIPGNITILKDEVFHLDDGLGYIAGIDYRNETNTVFAQKAKQILGDYEPVITILHDPKHREQLVGKTGLVLSGHTHGGQMFPGTLLVRYLYGKKMKGLVTGAETIFYTTLGIGTSLVPARIGTRPEVVVLSIV